MKAICRMFLTMAIFLLLCSTAFAAIPHNAIIIGNKAYSIDYLMDPTHEQEINNAIANAGDAAIYYQLDGFADVFTNVFTNQPATQAELSSLPQIEYTDASGHKTIYAPGGGDPISANKANATVTVGAMSFKDIKVNSTDVTGGVKFSVDGSTEVSALGGSIRILNSASTVKVSILDASGNVLATGDLDISQSTNSIDFNVTMVSSGGDNEELKVLSIE